MKKTINNVKKTVNISESKKKKIDYSMSLEKISDWAKDGDFKYWDTTCRKPCSDTMKNVLWIEFNIAKESFSCWVCRKYPKRRSPS